MKPIVRSQILNFLELIFNFVSQLSANDTRDTWISKTCSQTEDWSALSFCVALSDRKESRTGVWR